MILNNPEKSVMIAVLLLLCTGLIFVFSVSGPYSQLNEHPSWFYFFRQSVWAILALAVLFVGSRINYRKFLKLSPVLIACALAFLIYVLVTPSQMNVNRWLGFGFLRFQPSELFKIVVIMYFAYALVDKKEKLKQSKHLWAHLGIAGLGILLIAKQPDLGTMTLVFTVLALMLFLAGLKLRYLVLAGTVIAMLGAGMVFGLGYERDRVDDYLAALSDPLERQDDGAISRGYYQNRQSLISVGSGGLIGRGLGGGGQKNLFLPAPHTDFIFSASAEEGGLVLCMFILSLLLIICVGSLKIAARSSDMQGFLLASGLGIMLTFQAVINIGVALGLLPITGITLPFFSYGGSSLVVSCAAVGLILSVARHGKKPRIKYARAL